MSAISTDKLPVPQFRICLLLLRVFFGGSLTRYIRRRISERSTGSIALTNPLPHLRTMDWDIGIDLEAQAHTAVRDLEYGHLEHGLKAAGASDHNRFQALSRQDQHG